MADTAAYSNVASDVKDNIRPTDQQDANETLKNIDKNDLGRDKYVDSGKTNAINEQDLTNIRETGGKLAVNVDPAKVNPKEKFGITNDSEKLGERHIPYPEIAGANSTL